MSMQRTLSSLAATLVLALSPACKKQGEPEPVTPEPVAKPDPAPMPEPKEEAKAPERAYPEPPAPTAPKPVNFPSVDKFTLANGLTVYVVESHEVPIVSSQLVVRCGSMDAEFEAPFASLMLGEGTKSRSKAKIDEAIEFVGGQIGGGAGMHTTTVRTRVLKKDLKLALTLLADEVINPTFPADALQKQKEQAKTALSANKASPQLLAAVLFDMVAYPDGHPYGRPYPTDAQIDGVSLEDIVKFHDTFYRANNSFLIMAGDITKSEAEPLVKRTFGKWKSVKAEDLPPNPLNKFKAYDLPKELTVHLVDRPASAQTEVIIGNLALARDHEDWPKLQVLNAILGNDASGRLFQDIREDRGLAYGISSNVEETQAPGTWYVSTRTRTKTTGQMLAAIFEHIKRIRTEAPPQDEVTNVVNKLVGQFPLELETPNQIAAKVREQLVYNLKSDYWRTYRDKLAAVTPDDVQAVARKYVHPLPHIVVVGKAKKIEKQIAEVLPKAKIVKYNTELEKL